MSPSQYTPAEGKARDEIDQKLAAAGWVVQTRPKMNLYEGPGQAVREFTLKDGHGRVDYLLFVDQAPVGTIEAKPDGTTLVEVELQSLLCTTGLPEQFSSPFERLPFAFESTGKETRFTNGLDPEPRSRRLFSFPRPETLKGWTVLPDDDEPPTTLWRLQDMPPLIADNLWQNQERAVRNLETSLANGRRRALIQMATGSGKTFTAANASTGFSVLRPKPHVDPRFLFHRVLENGFVNQLSERQTGSSYPAVRERDVRAMSVAIPPLPEQQRIVEVIEEQFSRLDAGVESLQRAKRNLDALRTSALRQVFRSIEVNHGEEIQMRLPEVGEVARGKSRHRPRNAPSLFSGSYPFIQRRHRQLERPNRVSQSVPIPRPVWRRAAFGQQAQSVSRSLRTSQSRLS